MDRRSPWNDVYRSKDDANLSWFQARPELSLSLIDSMDSPPRRVIDVGGGQSVLAGDLLARGVEEIVVLDIAEAAIERGRARLGAQAGGVQWIVADVLDAGDVGEFDLWHDRAVFHFLVDAEDRRRYEAATSRAVVPGGHLIVATFAPTGPNKCSGLPVCRYDATALAHEFVASFELINSLTETHTTPWGKTQDFTYVLLRRTVE